MSPTLTEFLTPVRHSATRLQQVLAAMYYAQVYQNTEFLDIPSIRELLVRGQIPRARRVNISDVLTKAGQYVEISVQNHGRRLYSLTKSGLVYVRQFLGIPDIIVETEHEVTSLRQLLARIGDSDVQDYVEEAVRCLEANLLRPAIVFLWAGAVQTLRQQVLDQGPNQVTVALQKHDKRARAIKSLDDFSYVKDAMLLQIAQDLSVIDKSERQRLETQLKLRNLCAHPSKYRPRINASKAFIEDVLSIIFSSRD